MVVRGEADSVRFVVRGSRLALLAVASVVLVSGCVHTIAGSPQPADGDDPAASGDTRDAHAVAVAVRNLDPCKLLDVDLARSDGDEDAHTLRTGPHSCLLSPTEEYDPVENQVRVAVGGQYRFGRRYNDKPVEISGVKAYKSYDDSECAFHIPVSSARSVDLNYRPYRDSRPCESLEPYAASAAKRLTDPDELELTSDHMYMAWDGCGLVSQVLGSDSEDYEFATNGGIDPLSGCDVSVRKDEDGSPRTDDEGFELVTDYTSWPPDPADNKREIGGYDVYGRDGERCTATWSPEDSVTAEDLYSNLVLELTGDSCERVEKLVEPISSLAEEEPDDTDVEPQRPLYYEEDESDIPVEGACVDLGGNTMPTDCEPYRSVKIPDDKTEIVEAAMSDGNVACALANDAVAEVYGRDFKPVTLGQGCYYVKPSHTLQISVGTGTGPGYKPAGYCDGTAPGEREVTKVGGNGAVTCWHEQTSAFDVWVSPYDDIERNSMVHIMARAHVARGDLGSTNPDIAREKIKKVETVMAKIVQQHFG